MTYARLLIIVSLMSISHLLGAQNSPGLKSFIPPSPNASSLGKYGEVPVGYYTGIPNISIPLTTFKSRELELPITLNYHAGGIKVEEVASWVGLGWSLNAGGVITRSIRGLPDDFNNGYFNTRVTMNALGIKYKDYVGIPDRWVFSDGNGLQEDINMYEQILAQLTDAEPDIFYFNFGNFSGKFFMNPNGSFVVAPQQALKIEQVSGTAGVTRWTITTPDGTRYVFGTSLNAPSRTALEKTYNESTTTAVTGWYLIEIISPNNDRIDLYYTLENYNYYSKASEVINKVFANSTGCLPEFEKKVLLNFYEGCRLNRIVGCNGDILFNPTPAQRNDLPGSFALESLHIRDAQSTVLKKINLLYSDFNSLSSCSTGDFYCKRLKLDAVEQTSSNGLENGGKHTFEYSSIQLPSRSPYSTAMNSQDMWGYFNGASNSVLPRGGKINAPSGLQTVFGGDRHSDDYFMQAGMLTKITYPTGGYSYFDYESNKLYTTDNNLGFTSIEPVSKSTGLTLLTGDTKTIDFSVIYADPSTSMVRVTITNRQQLQNCDDGACFHTYIEGRNSTVLTRYYFPEGTMTLDLFSGDYRLGGTTYPGYESRISAEPKVYYLNLNWLEYPISSSTMIMGNKTVGGLRIKRVSSFSGSGTGEIKKYEYSKFSLNESSGVAVYINTANRDMFHMQVLSGGTTKLCSYVQFKSSTLVPLVPTLGGVIGYANVTEFIGENGEAGKTEYTFTTALTYPDQIKDFRPYPPSASYDWRRGLLLLKTHYKNSPTGFVRIAETENTYSFENNSIETYAVAVGKEIYSPVMALSGIDYLVAGYKTPSEFHYLQTEKTRMYDPVNTSSSLETIKTYEYGIPQGHYQLTRMTETASDLSIKEINNKYPQDLVLTGEGETARQSLVNKFMIGAVLEQTTKLGGVQTSKTTTDYKDFNSALTLPAKINFQTGTSAPIEERVNFNTYDDYGNILEQARKNDYKNGYQWGYNNALPVAEVKNASNYKSTANLTGIVLIDFGGAAPSPTYNFTVDYTGTVTLKLSVQGSPTYTTVATYSGMSSGSVTLLKGGCGLTTVTFTNIAPGAKSLTLTLSSPDGGSVLGACGQIVYPQKEIVKEFYFENFEESALATTNATIAHTGKKYYTGDYTVSFTLPNSRNYMIEYWYLDVGNIWKYISKTYTGTSMLLSEGSAIDNVRIYPTDARMKSYTYEPTIGITSTIDENGSVLKYYYDTFGRLLQVNNEKGIEKQFRYNYKTN